MADLEKPIATDGAALDMPAKYLHEDDSDTAVDPAEKAEPEKEKKGSLADYLRVFKYADRLDVVLFTIALSTSVAVGAALPLMTVVFGSSTSTFNQVGASVADRQQFQRRIDHLVLYFLYIFAARLVLTYIGTLCITIAATRTTRSLRKAFFESTLRQEVWHFDKADNGSTATQVTTNGNRIYQGLAEKLYLLVQGISLFFSGFIVALVVQWKLALIVMSIIPVIFVITGICIFFDIRQEAQITKWYSQAAVLAQDAISSIRTIHAFGAHAKIVKRYDSYLELAHREGDKKSANYGVLFSHQTFCVTAGTALAFWEGFRLFQSGEIAGAGTVFTVVLSISIAATAIMIVSPQFQSISNASSAASELFTIIDKASLLDPLAEEGIQPPTCEGDLQIRDLCFAYPTRPTAQVLNNLCLSIPAGKTTALVGASGCGKSTLIGLLERWYEFSSGQILLDGKDMTSYNTKWLRSNIRLVQQEPVLFSGTIYENVAKGLVGAQLDLSDEEKMNLVQEACKASNAHDFTIALPEGYHTQVGERASMLSGGQRQRVAIARSIISDPKILLLDEATSALDPRAERVVQDALDRVSANKTTLIIAHKLATVKSADSIAVISAGQVVEQGTHKELVELDGQYAAMVRAQDLGSNNKQEADISDEPSNEESEEEQNEKETLDHVTSLQRTNTKNSEQAKDDSPLTRGTLNMSLLKCLYITLSEQSDMWPWYIVLTLASVIGGGVYPAQAIIFSRLITVFTLTGASAQASANFWSLMFFVLAIATLFGYFAIGWSCNAIAQVITHRYRREMIERVLDLDQEFFDQKENSSGALTSKMSSYPTALFELLSFNLGLIIIVLVNIVASSALGIAYGWKLGLVLVFGGLPVLILAGASRIRLEMKLEESAGERSAQSAGLATEAVTSIRTLSSLTLESHTIKEYNDMLDGVVTNTIKSIVITLIPYALSQSVDFLVLALGFWYGATLITSGEYTPGQFFVVFIATVFSGQAAGQFFGYTSSITKAKVAANYILWLRTLKAAIRDDETNEGKGPSGDGAVSAEDVEFRYKQRDASRVLRGISITIEPGTYAAFVGPSGCGKSTIIALLQRFYDPTSGRICFADQDIATFSPRLYRRHMSLVQQEPPLYQGSVRENIALGLEYEPSDDEIRDACRQSNALDFISSLPEGLDTPCGAKGLQFSGGQRQRIAVARALVRKPRLLLLDEATSALDTQSERVVQRALDDAAAKDGRTTIAVAHRLSTIRHAAVIFVVADGKIAEAGTHEELKKKRGMYYAMVLAQSLDNNEV